MLNLEGIFTRYQNADRELDKIAKLPKERATAGMQKIYEAPVDQKLINLKQELGILSQTPFNPGPALGGG